MACFPFFVDLEQKEGLIVGGGVTALRKIRKLLPYGPRLTAVSLSFHREIEKLPSLTLLRRPFDPELLERKFFVIAATNQPQLNHDIAALCRQREILVNVVDDREACTFLFPALVKRGELSIGVSTGGASPSAAIWLKEQIGALVPDNMEELLEAMETQRGRVRALFPEEARRSEVLKALWLTSIRQRRPLDREETEAFLRQFLEVRSE